MATREVRPSILIVTEGEQTERLYFEAFPVTSLTVKVVGTGFNTDSLVAEAERLARLAKYDQVWVVFDRDSFPVEHFRAAFVAARKAGFQVAWSNECFEIWFLLHFHYRDNGASRDTYRKALERLLGRRYEKNDARMYEDLRSRQADAIRNARLLHERTTCEPEEANPCTTVYQLVEELNRHVR